MSLRTRLYAAAVWDVGGGMVWVVRSMRSDGTLRNGITRWSQMCSPRTAQSKPVCETVYGSLSHGVIDWTNQEQAPSCSLTEEVVPVLANQQATTWRSDMVSLLADPSSGVDNDVKIHSNKSWLSQERTSSIITRKCCHRCVWCRAVGFLLVKPSSDLGRSSWPAWGLATLNPP